MEPNFFLNGQANGSVAQTLLNSGLDPDALRPWTGLDGKSYRSLYTGQVWNAQTKQMEPQYKTVLSNTSSTLRKEEWQVMDSAVERVARTPMRAWADLRGANTLTVPNGLGTIILQHQTMSDAGVATVSMDGLREAERDRPVHDLRGLPLPIISGDVSFSIREIMVSRNGGPGLDTSMVEATTDKVLRVVEGLTLGTAASFTYGGYTIYGYTNHPNRITYTMTSPAAAGWTPSVTIDDILAMRQAANNDFFYGPFMLYLSPSWDLYMDADYSEAKGNNTLRQRLRAVPGIGGVETAYFLTGYTALLVQMTPNVARAVVGMDVRTLQWESHGGMMLNFKIMCIMVPQIRYNADGNTGIVHGSV